MTCEKYNSRIADFAAADVAAAFRPADVSFDHDLAAHLESCAACRAALDAQRSLLASIDRGLASMVAPEPSGDFAAHMRQRIAQEGVSTRSWFAGWQFVTAATVLILVVIAGVLTIGRPSREPQSVRETPPAPVVPEDKSRAIAPSEAPVSVATNRRPPRLPQSAANREPEVLVPRGEMAAVMRLYDANWNGKADGASLMAVARSVTDSLKPMAITELRIPALEVEPIEGGEKRKGTSENR